MARLHAHPARPSWARPRATLAALLVAVLAAGCASSGWSPRGDRTDELGVYETTARFVVQHYDPVAEDDVLDAVCLAVGRRADRAVTLPRRDGEWDPDGGLLRRLEGLAHPVVPVSECAWGGELQEIHVPSGGPALALGISHPSWESRTVAHVAVASRESEAYTFRYHCRVEWRVDQWKVEWCLPPDPETGP